MLNVRTRGGAVRVTHGGKQRSYWKIFSGLLVPSHPPNTILSARGYSSRVQRSQKCDFAQTLTISQLCPVIDNISRLVQRRNASAGGASAPRRIPVEVVGRDSGASTEVRPIKQVTVFGSLSRLSLTLCFTKGAYSKV